MKRIIISILSLAVLGAGCSFGQKTSPAPAKVNPSTPAAQQGNVSLVTIDLSGKGLSAIPMDVFFRFETEVLNLSKNKLTGAPQSQIGQLARLRTLDLSNNQITGLPAELGRLGRLEVLNVSNNQLTGLPVELGNLTQLRVLDVSGNNYSKQDLDSIAAKLPNTQIRR